MNSYSRYINEIREVHKLKNILKREELQLQQKLQSSDLLEKEYQEKISSLDKENDCTESDELKLKVSTEAY